MVLSTKYLPFGWWGFFIWTRTWQPTPLFVPAECQGQRSLVGYTVDGVTELERTEAT